MADLVEGYSIDSILSEEERVKTLPKARGTSASRTILDTVASIDYAGLSKSIAAQVMEQTRLEELNSAMRERPSGIVKKVDMPIAYDPLDNSTTNINTFGVQDNFIEIEGDVADNTSDIVLLQPNNPLHKLKIDSTVIITDTETEGAAENQMGHKAAEKSVDKQKPTGVKKVVGAAINLDYNFGMEDLTGFSDYSADDTTDEVISSEALEAHQEEIVEPSDEELQEIFDTGSVVRSCEAPDLDGLDIIEQEFDKINSQITDTKALIESFKNKIDYSLLA